MSRAQRTPTVAETVTRAARANPGATYLEDVRSPRQVRFEEVAARAEALRAERHRLGLPVGAPMALDVADHLEYAVSFAALLAAGHTVVPLPPGAPGPEKARVLELTFPLATTGGAGVLLCTSGTTGSPKVVGLSERQLLYVAANVARHHGLAPGERGFSPLPLHHINGQVVGLLATLVAGATLVLDDRFHRSDFWDLVSSRSITWVNAVPAIITLLAGAQPPARSPAHVRFVRSASAPLPVATLRRFEEAASIRVLESYGMTEAASMITANPLTGRRKAGSVGLPVGTELRVVGDEYRCLPSGEVGRVEIRGGGVISSYASATPEGAVRPDGWLATRDLGYLDDEGYLYLVGRADDVINRGGENIYPREVEEVLVSDPRVRAAAVVGVPDSVLGHRPVGFIVPLAAPFASGGPGEGSDSEADLVRQLQARCRDSLSSFKVPTELHLVDALPVGPTGKVSHRRVLAELAVAGGQ